MYSFQYIYTQSFKVTWNGTGDMIASAQLDVHRADSCFVIIAIICAVII